MTTGRWNKHDPGPLKRWGHTATVVGERMYVVGGFAGSSQGYLNDVNAFDSSHGKWVSSGSVTKKIAAPPPPSSWGRLKQSDLSDRGDFFL